MGTTFDSLDLKFIRVWKEIIGSAPADWTPNSCESGHSSFISFRDWWSRSTPPVNIGIFRETLRCLRGERGRQPTFEDVKRHYRTRAGLTATDAAKVTCEACNGTGVVLFITLMRRGVVYCVDPQRPKSALRPGEYLGTGSAPCLCVAGKAVNERWHMPASVMQRCHRSRMTQSEMDTWRLGPLDPNAPDAGSRAINEAVVRVTPATAAATLVADDPRRAANLEEWDGPPPEKEEEPF